MLNYSKTIKIIISLLYTLFYGIVKHSSDITILIVLLWFSVLHYSSLFQYIFLSIYYRPYSSWKLLIFNTLVKKSTYVT